MTEPRQAAELIDWAQLGGALQRFALTTGLCACAYGQDGVRNAGPYCSSRVSTLLQRSGGWGAGAAVAALEGELVQEALVASAPLSRRIDDEVEILAVPVLADGQVAGIVVMGWVFTSFTTALACKRLAATLGVESLRLWAEARLESPVPRARLDIASKLLGTILDLLDQHARSIAALRRLSSMRESFLAYVSHELRTPLHAISLRIQVLLRSSLQDPAHLREQLMTMARHVEDEARLVEDLIDAARTRTGQLTLIKSISPMREWVARAADSVRPMAEEKQVLFLITPEEEFAAVWVEGDAGRLQQMLWNLLANAVKFTPVGGEVNLGVQADDAVVRLTVADTGSGIDPALLPRVFEPFTKVGRGNSKGLGLGLAIAKEIAERHGGSIGAQSAGPGAGSTFWIQLNRLQRTA